MDSTVKVEIANKLRAELEPCSAFVLVTYSGLTVTDSNAVRAKFRDAGCKFAVYKNSTVRFATEGTKHAVVKDLLSGVTALAYNVEDPGAPARVARDFAKDNDKFSVKGGVIDGTLLDAKGVSSLADMPGPRELKAQFLALLNTPATHMVRVLNAPAQALLNVLNAKKDKDAA